MASCRGHTNRGSVFHPGARTAAPVEFPLPELPATTVAEVEPVAGASLVTIVVFGGWDRHSDAKLPRHWTTFLVTFASFRHAGQLLARSRDLHDGLFLWFWTRCEPQRRGDQATRVNAIRTG